MDAKMQTKLNNMMPGRHFVIGTVDGSVVNAEIVEFDRNGKSLTFRDLDNLEEETMSLDQIDMLDEYEDIHHVETIDEQLKRIQIGKYLMVWGKFDNYTINETCEQGKLESIDWNKRTIVLKSTVYDGRKDTVNIDKIRSIDESRERSGALGPAQAPDWYRGADGKWRKNGREYEA